MNLQRCVYALLEDGAADWVYAAEVASVVKWTGGADTEDEIRELSLELIREVVQQGFMKIGDLLGEGGRFCKWEMSDKEALERVDHEWRALGTPSLGEICWLCNTEKGDRIGNRLLDLWNAPQDCAEKLLMRSTVYGRVGLDWIEWLVERVGGATPQTKLEAAIKLIREVVQQGLMEIGDPTVRLKFNNWDIPIEAALDRVEREWKALGRGPTLGEICWLQNTSKGNELGEELYRRRKGAP